MSFAMSLFSGVFSALGAIAEGQAQKQAADFNAKVSEQRAISERNAAGVEASDFKRGEMRQVRAAQAARGAAGVTMAGSPLLVDEATVREVALGSSRIKHGGQVKGTRLEQDAELERMRGKAAETASYIRAGSSLLGSFGRAFS